MRVSGRGGGGVTQGPGEPGLRGAFAADISWDLTTTEAEPTQSFPCALNILDGKSLSWKEDIWAANVLDLFFQPVSGSDHIWIE